MRCIELYAGCGGMALGLKKAGFEHELLVDFDAACFSLDPFSFADSFRFDSPPDFSSEVPSSSDFTELLSYVKRNNPKTQLVSLD